MTFHTNRLKSSRFRFRGDTHLPRLLCKSNHVLHAEVFCFSAVFFFLAHSLNSDKAVVATLSYTSLAANTSLVGFLSSNESSDEQVSVADNAPRPLIQITIDNNIPESINNEIHSEHSNRYCTGNVISSCHSINRKLFKFISW